MKGKRYFKCEANKGMFILAKEIQRKLSPEELIQKIVHLSEALSRSRSQRNVSLRQHISESPNHSTQKIVKRLMNVNEELQNIPNKSKYSD